MSKELIFVVDDEFSSRELLKHYLIEGGYEVMPIEGGEECLKMLDKDPFAICLDMMMPGLDGLETLKQIKTATRNIPVIMITSDGAVDSAVEAMKIGAYDYIVKPVDGLRLCTTLKKAIEQHSMTGQLSQMKAELKKTYSYKNIIGKCSAMKKVFAEIEKVNNSNINVFLQGDSGTGKELVAKAIHHGSGKTGRPMVDINCGAIPETLQESELFGHEKGAFTGAIESKKGKFEIADGGTLFLDEVSEMSLSTQVKFLRFLQEKTFERVGGIKKIKVDLRVISATNKDLFQAVKEGKFREDLYYRLVVYPINIPPLKERQGDIPLLIRHFLKKYNAEINKQVKTIDAEAMRALTNYHWPGNVRELENAIYRAMVCTESDIIQKDCLPEEIYQQSPERTEWQRIPSETDKVPAANKVVEKKVETTPGRLITLEEAEKQALASALKMSAGDFPKAAKQLGISRATFYRKAKKHEIVS